MSSFEELNQLNKANSIINRANADLGLRPMYLHDLVEDLEKEIQKEKAYLEEEARKVLEENFTTEEVETLLEEHNEEFLSARLREEILAKLKEQQGYESPSSDFTVEQRSINPDEIAEEFTMEALDAELLGSADPEPEAQQTKAKEPKVEQSIALEKELEKYRSKILVNGSNSYSFSKTAIFTSLGVLAAVFLIFAFKPVSTAGEDSSNFESSKLEELAGAQDIKKLVNSNQARNLIICSGSFANEAEAKSYKNSLKKKLGVPLKIVEQAHRFSVQIGPSYEKHEDALLVFDELSRYSVQELSIHVAS